MVGFGLASGGEEARMAEKSKPVVRPAMGAGRWFPDNPALLKKMLAEFLDEAPGTSLSGRVVSAIAPHAGYQYSGKVAGHVFRVLRDQAQQGLAPETVVILGLSHRQSFTGVALMDGAALATPLGAAPLDQAAADFLIQHSSRIRFDYAWHRGEHSAENQVPFVQAALPQAGLVIGLIGDHQARTLEELTAALVALAHTKKILVIASSDMLHSANYDLVTETDQRSLRAVTALQSKELLQAWSFQHQTFCGLAAVLVALEFAKAQGCPAGQVLLYRNSGDYFPESRGQWVVGYGAVVFALP